MVHSPAGQPDPAEYEFLHLFFREVSRIDIIPGRAAYLPLTRRLERARTLEKLGGNNPFETFTRLINSYQTVYEQIAVLTAAHRLPEIDLGELNGQIENFIDQTDRQFPPALTSWIEKLPKAIRDEGCLIAWELLWLTSLVPPERRDNLPQVAFSTAYVFHFKDVRQQAADSLRRLTEGTLRYVVVIARLYVGRGVPYLDLIHAGYTGLLRAANLFTERGGAHFQHYASNWIRQRIDRQIIDTANLIRVPVHAQTDIQMIRRFEQRVKRRKGITPTDEEVAVGVGWVTEEDLYQAAAVETAPETDADDLLDEQPDDESDDATLETPISPQYTRHAHKVIGRVRLFRGIANVASLERSDGVTRLVDNQFPLSTLMEARLLRDALKQALERLNPREAKIIALRYGLEDGEMWTLEAVGQRLGITRERVRQIEARVLSTLRQSSLMMMLGHVVQVSDERSFTVNTHLTHQRTARYTPPPQERAWVDDMIARYITRGRRGNVARTDTQRGRARIYAEVLREAGSPLPYREIHARAVERYPELGELPLSTIYSTLFYRDEFVSFGRGGVFGLVEPESANQAAGHSERPLSPLLPPNAPPNRLLDSVMYGLDQLTRTPNMTARAFLTAQTAYLRLEPPTDAAAQAGFEVWAALGLIEPVRYPHEADTPLRLKTTRRIGEPMISILGDFLAHFAGSVLKTAELLSALDRIGRADLNTLNLWVFGGKSNRLSEHLKILAGLNAVSWDGAVWAITALGREVLGRLPVADLPEPPTSADELDEDDSDELIRYFTSV